MESSLDDAQATMLKAMDELASNPPTAEEVERAKKRILKDWELGFKSSTTVGLRMSEYIAMGDWRLAFLFRDYVESVKAEDVVNVSKKYFKPSNRTIGRFVPDKSPDRADIPDAPNLEPLLSGYKGKAPIAEGENFDPAPENIEKRTTRGEASDKGIEFAFLPKETRGNSVSARMTLRFGDEKSLMNQDAAAAFTAMMLDKGTKTKSRQQIQDELDRLKARVQIFGGGATASVNIEAEHDNLVEVMKLVGDMLKNPSFTQEEFEKLKEEQLAAIESQRSDPQALAFTNFQRTMNSHYPKGDIRYVMTLDEEAEAIKNLKLDDVKNFYKKFYGTSDATVAVVGDFDQEALKKVTLDQFSNWKSPSGYTRPTQTYKEVKAGSESINTPDKANAVFIAGMPLNINDSDPDYPALVMGNFMLGGGFLNSRLAVRIRQKEGLSYGVGSSVSASSYEKSGMFQAFAIYAPENAAKLEAAFKEEIDKMRKDGFTAEELEAAKTGYIQSRGMNRAEDRSLSGTLNNYLQLDRTMLWDAELEKKIMALTPEQINAAMKKYVDPSKFVYVKAGDFEKAGKP